MDALLYAYQPSDSEIDSQDDDGGERGAKRVKLIGPLPASPTHPSRSPSSSTCPTASGLALVPQSVIPAYAGRYVSKRERAQAAAAATDGPAVVSTPPVLPLPDLERVLRSHLPKHMHRRVQNLKEGALLENYLPKALLTKMEGHEKGVNAVRWSPTHGCLLASAGMDQVAYIWNAWNESGKQRVRTISSHTASVKDVQWSRHGDTVLTCGFDKTIRLADVETGTQKQMCVDDQFVHVAKFHPLQGDTFLSGGSEGFLRLWDLRSGKQVLQYSKGLGQILDLDFHPSGKQFVSSSDIAQRNASEKAVVVWNFETQVPLSNQVYLEAYTCPSVRYHPNEESFIAQSNGNYIAIFSARPPFKMNKYKRFEGHQVAGFPLLCNFSPDGEYIVTGSADGSTCFYSWRTAKMLRRLEMSQSVVTDAAYHPFMPSVVATCSWDGAVYVYN